MNGESDFLPVLGCVEFRPGVILVVDWAVDTKHQSTRPGFLFHWCVTRLHIVLVCRFRCRLVKYRSTATRVKETRL